MKNIPKQCDSPKKLFMEEEQWLWLCDECGEKVDYVSRYCDECEQDSEKEGNE